jgi:hypothetical protein
MFFYTIDILREDILGSGLDLHLMVAAIEILKAELFYNLFKDNTKKKTGGKK